MTRSAPWAAIVVLLIALIVIAGVASDAQSQIQKLVTSKDSTDAIERRAFLAGAATGWNPGTDRWEQYKIDRDDPDWEEAFRSWIDGGRQ